VATHEDFMRRAIALSRKKLVLGERPFGCVIVRHGEVVGEGSAQQHSTNDPTAHAEITAIRNAARALGTNDLSECTLYTSCEPCPMCTAAIWYTGIAATYYGNVRTDFNSTGRDTGSVLEQTCLPMEKRARRHVRLLAGEAKQVIDDWQKMPEFARVKPG
jgi:guanine deaminase